MVQTNKRTWVKVGKRVLQAVTPTPLQDRIEFTATGKLTTLYTADELHDWEQFNAFPTMQRSRHQRILNELCLGETCSYGSNSLLQKPYDISQLSTEAEEALLAKLNPFGFWSAEWNLVKEAITSVLILEYFSVMITCISATLMYRVKAMIGALINRITLNWSRLRACKRPITKAIQLERLLNNTEEP